MILPDLVLVHLWEKFDDLHGEEVEEVSVWSLWDTMHTLVCPLRVEECLECKAYIKWPLFKVEIVL